MSQFRNHSAGARGVYDAEGKLHMVEAGQLTPDVKLAKGEPNKEWFGDPDQSLAERGEELAGRISKEDQELIEGRFDDLRKNFDAQLKDANERADAAEEERDDLKKEVEALTAKVAELEEAGEGSGSDADEPGPLDGSIEELTTHIDAVDDAAEIQRLVDAEKAGKSRKGALDALNARLEALKAPKQ